MFDRQFLFGLALVALIGACSDGSSRKAEEPPKPETANGMVAPDSPVANWSPGQASDLPAGKAVLEVTGSAELGVVEEEETLFSLTLKNTGPVAASGLKAKPPELPFEIVGTDCPELIGPQASCNLELKFSSADPGSYSNTFEVAFNNGLEEANLEVSLTAEVPEPEVFEGERISLD